MLRKCYVNIFIICNKKLKHRIVDISGSHREKYFFGKHIPNTYSLGCVIYVLHSG